MDLHIGLTNSVPMKKRVSKLDPAILAEAFDRKPVTLDETTLPETGVVTPAESAFARKAAKVGLNVDFIPQNRRKP